MWNLVRIARAGNGDLASFRVGTAKRMLKSVGKAFPRPEATGETRHYLARICSELVTHEPLRYNIRVDPDGCEFPLRIGGRGFHGLSCPLEPAH